MSRPDETLLDYLRLRRSLRGTKEGCAEGDCGACTVLVGRLLGGKLVYESVNACIRFLGSLDGCHVVTVEHLRGEGRQAASGAAGDGRLPRLAMRLLHAGLRHVALRAVDALAEPSVAAIEKALQGNLCRCTGYEAIVRAARAISNYGKAAKDPLAAERKAIDAQARRRCATARASRSARASGG